MNNSIRKEYSRRASKMVALIHDISPLQRMINSDGLDEAFEIIRNELPDVVIHEYHAGTACEDWIVPKNWQVVEGFMQNKTGEIIASIRESKLFVAPYSEPVDGWFTKTEIERHLRTRPDRPDAFAFEHRNAYNYQLVDWGITMPHNRWLALPESEYHVKIDVELKSGSMKVAELFLEGRRPETICICAHIDELCNDDLSGCALGIELMHHIASLPNRQYCYQLLLVPEMFGSLFFAYNNPEKLKRTICMLNLEAVGAGENLCIKRALEENTRPERALFRAAQEEESAFQKLGFFEGYENDERVYGWPTLGITGIALQRYPFAEYHTSDDTPDIINPKYMLEALMIAERFVDIMEKDYVPVYKNRLQPWLTRRGVYFDSKDDPQRFQKFNNMVLFGINGQRSILDLADRAGLGVKDVSSYLCQLFKADLIEKQDVDWSQPSNTTV